MTESQRDRLLNVDNQYTTNFAPIALTNPQRTTKLHKTQIYINIAMFSTLIAGLAAIIVLNQLNYRSLHKITSAAADNKGTSQPHTK
jgi:hypothetical protein